jgi:hypothetical protein
VDHVLYTLVLSTTKANTVLKEKVDALFNWGVLHSVIFYFLKSLGDGFSLVHSIFRYQLCHVSSVLCCILRLCDDSIGYRPKPIDLKQRKKYTSHKEFSVTHATTIHI